MRVALFGSSGQLGTAIAESWPRSMGELLLPSRLIGLELRDVEEYIRKVKADVVINCIAMTNLDYCEVEPNSATLVNETFASNLALACSRHKIHLIHVSTDYCFGDEPVQSAYACSKLHGEGCVRGWLVNHHTIIRLGTLLSSSARGWVYSVARKAAKHEVVRVAAQVCNPTTIDTAVREIFFAVKEGPQQTIHVGDWPQISRHALAHVVAGVVAPNSRNDIREVPNGTEGVAHRPTHVPAVEPSDLNCDWRPWLNDLLKDTYSLQKWELRRGK